MTKSAAEFQRRAKADAGYAREELVEDLAYAWRDYAEHIRVLAEVAGLPFETVLNDLMTGVADQFAE